MQFPNPDHTWSYMIGSKFVIKSLINWANWAHKPMPSIAIPCCVLALHGTNANDSKAGTKECTLCARGNTREKQTLEGLSGVHGISWYLKVFHEVSWCCFSVSWCFLNSPMAILTSTGKKPARLDAVGFHLGVTRPTPPETVAEGQRLSLRCLCSDPCSDSWIDQILSMRLVKKASTMQTATHTQTPPQFCNAVPEEHRTVRIVAPWIVGVNRRGTTGAPEKAAAGQLKHWRKHWQEVQHHASSMGYSTSSTQEIMEVCYQTKLGRESCPTSVTHLQCFHSAFRINAGFAVLVLSSPGCLTPRNGWHCAGT
jgi:hypothetical protein